MLPSAGGGTYRLASCDLLQTVLSLVRPSTREVETPTVDELLPSRPKGV